MRGKRIWLVALVVVAVAAFTWAFLQPRERLFRGKTESAWLAGIAYADRGEEQSKQWMDFGPEGIRMLSRGLLTGTGPLERAYFNTWPKVPLVLRSHLPKPVEKQSERMCAAWLLCEMGTNAQGALPALERSLQVETRSGVRCLVIDWFDKVLPNMDEQQKLKYLPYFLKDLEGPNSSERNNSAIALGFYPAQKDVVAPALTRALHDPIPYICLVAADSLNRVDPAAADRASIVPVMTIYLTNMNDQIGMFAARLLGDIHRRPDIAVPALIEISQGTNYEVAASALHALGNFKNQSATIIPILRKATNHPDGRMRYAAKMSLREMQSAPPAQQNSK